MITRAEILKRLQEAILNSRLTQEEIAKKINVDKSTISSYLYSNICPSLKTFVKLCDALNISADIILGLKK